jgi:predicted Zn-dependent peptidase
MEMNGIMEDAGGDLNGITMRDQSLYYTPVHPRHLGTAFAVLGDILSFPLLAKMEIEREIILEEIMDEVDHRGRDIDLGNLSKMQIFGEHPLAFKIAGTPSIIRSLTKDDLQKHHQSYYVAQNMVVCVAGPLKHSQVLEVAQQTLGKLSSGAPIKELPPSPPTNRNPVLFVPHQESQTEIMLGFPCPTENHPDYLALLLLRALLDDGLTSWLPLYVVEKRGLAYSVHAGIDTFVDAAVFEIEASCTPAKTISLIEEIANLLNRLRDQPVDEQELIRVKRKQRMGLEFMLDDLNSLAGWYGGTELFRIPEPYEKRIERLEKVTAQEIQQVAQKVFSRQNLYLCAVGPTGKNIRKQLAKTGENFFH